MPEFTGHRDLREYLAILWRWKWVFLVFVMAAPVAAYLIERGKPNTYKSSALVGVNTASVNTALINNGGSFSTSNVSAIAELVTTTPVADVAADLMHPPANPGQIVSEVSATGDTTTNFVKISAQDQNATRAAAIANAFAHAISSNLQSAAVGQLNNSIAGINSQLSRLGPNDPQRAPLEQQLTQLRAARATQGSEAAILQAATPSATPSRDLRRTLEIALVIGILLGLGAVVIAENADRRLRSPDDLEALTDLTLLAAIPPSAFSAKVETTREDEEAFRMLGAALMYFNDRNLASVLVTSAGEKEGKTTVATRLALALANGGMDVILVDADLRRAQVGAKLGIDAPAGLAAVLAGSNALSEVLVDRPLDAVGSGELKVLTVGPPPSNPSALLSSDAMERVLRELESQADLVIIDTPAALAVGDALPLMRNVSGVLVVARMNRSSRQTVRRLRRVIAAAHGNVLGVVATAVSASARYDGYSYKYYAKESSNGSHPEAESKRAETAPEPDGEPKPDTTTVQGK